MSIALGGRDRPFLALGFRLAMTLVMSLIMVLVKLASQRGIPLLQMVFFRQVVPLVMLIAWLAASGGWRRVRSDRVGVHTRRALFGLAGLFLIMASYQLLPLVVATVFSFTAPIFAVILAATTLRERVGVIRWSAVILGLAGVILMVWKGAGVPSVLGIICAEGGAFCVAATAIQIRDLANSDGPLVIVFWYFLVTALALAPPSLALMPRFDAGQWAVLLTAGFGTLLGQLCITASLRFGHVSSVIVMDYTALGWSTLWGWLIFAQLPPTMAWVGAPLIICSGLIIVLREARLARRRGTEIIDPATA